MERWKCEWVGSECGHHATYTFYKAVKFSNKFSGTNGAGAAAGEGCGLTPTSGHKSSHQSAKETWKVLSIGQFFFVKIWAGSDLLSVAELQLLWEDKTTGQMMSSVRLYLLPEYTTEGRQHYHGEDELVAVSEKSVLRVADLLDWLVTAETAARTWDRGTRALAASDCDTGPGPGEPHPPGPGGGLDLSEIEKIRTELGDGPGAEEVGVQVLSSSQYCRFRAVSKRLDTCGEKWLRNSLVVALGGFATRTRNTFVMFARETFDYPELEEHPLLCNHLAPKLKGRPRKRRKLKEVTGGPNSPEGSEHESNSSEGSNCSGVQKQPPTAKSRKDLLAILSQKNTKEETEFLKKLIKFMEERNTPIERPPMLGFKQIDLHMFFQKVSDQGGYDGCVSKKAWKSVYDELGGNPQNTSAATCTRRHYEKFLLTYERYINNMDPGQREEHLEETEADELEEKKESRTNGDGLEEAVKAEGDEKLEIVAKEEKSGEEEKPRETFTPKIGLKPLQLLTEPKLADVGKEDVKMKIDDLIIIPNNINHAAEEGSALQNLAKIASRYSSLQKDKSRAADFSSPSPKKTRVEEPGVAQPLPPTTNAKKPPVAPAAPSISAADPMSSSAASSLLQQFSLLSPGLFPGFPGLPGAASSPGPAVSAAPPSSAAASAAGWLGSSLGLDPSKIGQDGFQLLKYYEQQLKALQTGKSPRDPSPAKTNGLKDSSPTKSKDSKSKEKSKVCKLPPDTKRPPRLMQTPCPYSQTASIYGSPKSELIKARDSASKTNNNTGESVGSKPELGILDLSSSGGSGSLRLLPEPLTRHPVAAALPSPSGPRAPVTSDINTSVLNLSRPERQASVEQGAETVDLSMSRAPASEARPRPEVKASPFSAEALLSKPSQKPPEAPRSVGGPPPLSMGIKGLLESDLRRQSPQASPALPRASPSSGSTHSPGPGNDLRADRPSPHQVASSKPARQATPSSSFPSSLPASLAALYSAGYGLGPAVSSIPGLSTETTFSSLSSLSSSSLAPPSLPQQQQQNPYLSALMASPSLHGHQAQAAAMAAASKGQPQAAPGFPGLNPLDPASQYYAALYQQQVSAYQHAASAAALSPYGIRPGYPPGHAPGGGAAGAAAAAELQALQQYKEMMTRAAGAQASQAQAAAAAAANPYAALYGLMGYPGGFPGVGPGQRKDP